MKDWESCKVGEISHNPRWVNPDCQGFTTVSHTAHIAHALNIVSDMSIKSRLVYDESVLNTYRLPVVWLSPNSWAAVGSRYGSVEFWFVWYKILDKTKAYWGQLITAYNRPAPRILITGSDLSE